MCVILYNTKIVARIPELQYLFRYYEIVTCNFERKVQNPLDKDITAL